MQTRKQFWIREPVGTHGTAYVFVNVVQKGFNIHDKSPEEIIGHVEHTLK